jgi:hypothetical protein
MIRVPHIGKTARRLDALAVTRRSDRFAAED